VNKVAASPLKMNYDELQGLINVVFGFFKSMEDLQRGAMWHKFKGHPIIRMKAAEHVSPIDRRHIFLILKDMGLLRYAPHLRSDWELMDELFHFGYMNMACVMQSQANVKIMLATKKMHAETKRKLRLALGEKAL
jgi:hypothetical protein